MTHPQAKENTMDTPAATSPLAHDTRLVGGFFPLGAAIEGGILIGRFFLEEKPYALIVAPKQEGEFPSTAWSKSMDKVEGALSYFDGAANTRAMAEAGSPLAVKVLAFKIGGFEDWHLMSRGEALLAMAARDLMPETEAFEREWYWTSTQSADVSDFAWFQGFDDGNQGDWRKDYKSMARAVRRVAI